MKYSLGSKALLFGLLLGLVVASFGFSVTATEGEEQAWVLKEVLYSLHGSGWQPLPVPMFDQEDFYRTRIEKRDNSAELLRTSPRGRNSSYAPQDMHVIYTWSPIPEVIRAEENITIRVQQELLSNESGGYFTNFHFGASMGQYWEMTVVEPSNMAGVRYLKFGNTTGDMDDFLQTSGSVVYARDAWSAPRQPREQILELSLSAGSTANLRLRYFYEWKPIPQSTGYSAWQPDGAAGASADELAAELAALEKRFASFFEAVENMVRIGEEYRAASPDYLQDFNQLLDRYRE